jgi:predicted nuclease of predicted toxin-antitoxin system
MRLLLDQGLPRSTVRLLGDSKIEAAHVGDLGMASATDALILARARRDDYVVVTLDADFHTLLAASGAVSPSVIRIRVEGMRGAQLATMLRQILIRCDKELDAGAVVSADEKRIRVRSLPIGGGHG